MAELIAHFKKKEIEEQYDRVQIIATVVISKEDIDDIMVSALEGGITYRADKAEPRCGIEFNFASDVISKGGSILIHDNEEDATYELTKAKLLQGIRMYAEQPKSSDIFEVIDHELHIDCGMGRCGGCGCNHSVRFVWRNNLRLGGETMAALVVFTFLVIVGVGNRK